MSQLGKYAGIGLLYTLNKRFFLAQAYLQKYEFETSNKAQAKYNWVSYYAIKGEKQKALDNLEKAIQNGYKNLKQIKTDRTLASIRNEKRFQKLVNKLKEQLKR